MAIKFLAGDRLIGTAAERTAMSGGVDKANIKAYYQFNEAVDATLVNQATSGNGFANGTGTTNDSTATGSAVTRVSGKVGSYAYEFDGTADGIVAVGDGIFSGTGAYTIAVWIWKDADAGETILYLGRSQEMINYSYSTKKATGHNTPAVHATTSLGLGAWHHIAITRGEGGATVAKTYFDGTLEATGTNSTNIGNNYPEVYIGGYASVAGEAWNGKIDELIIADRAFTASEISSIYNSGTGGTLASMPLATLNLPNGAIFEESDTGTHYMWNGSTTWNEVT